MGQRTDLQHTVLVDARSDGCMLPSWPLTSCTYCKPFCADGHTPGRGHCHVFTYMMIMESTYPDGLSKRLRDTGDLILHASRESCLRDEQFNARDEYAGSGSSSNAGEVEGCLVLCCLEEVPSPHVFGSTQREKR